MIKIRNKILLALTLSVAFLIPTYTNAFAADPDTYKVETDYLNLRAEANPYSEINKTISQGEEVHKIREFLYAGSTWFYVKTDSGIKGWVNSDYLEENPLANDTTKKYDITFKINSDYLNVRENPESKILKVAQKDDILEFKHHTKEYNGIEWYLVELEGTTGWVKSTFMKENSRVLREILRPNGEPYQENHIYYDDFAIPYKNGGKTSGLNLIQSGIYASTWGGVPIFDGEDEKNTHFIGSRDKLFANLSGATSITVTDSENTPYKYSVTKIHYVNSTGVGENDVNYWDRITGEDGGERIVLQTSINESIKLIVEADFAGKIEY